MKYSHCFLLLFKERLYRIIFSFLLMVFILPHVQGQYQMERLNRGIVAVSLGGTNVFVSWRWLGTEDNTISFNLYRNGTKVNSSPLTVCNYTDNSGSATASYTVKAIVNGVEQTASEAVTPLAQQYFKIPISAPAGGTTPDGVTYTYAANDASVADLDGDGILEIILKWDPSNSKDNSNTGYTGNTYIDAYKMNGTRMWRIDFGRNIRSGAHYLDFMVYDFDGDGKAEMMARTADGTKDGTGVVIGSATADYRNSGGYVLSGPEYISVFNGQSGKAMATRNLYPPRGNVSDWGDGYGNRVDRFRACVAYLDGQRPSAVFVRGYYAKWGCEALDWRNGAFTQRWTYMCANDPNASCYEEGNHNLSVADVDDDGKQEVIMGSNIIDDNGTMYYNTAFGHGDALHVSDLDPSLPGLEVFNIQEKVADAGVYMYSAKNKKVLWQKPTVAGSDEGPGRGVSADVSSKWAGAECWVYGGLSGELMDCKGNFVGAQPKSGGSGVTCNFLVWWNGDLQREMFDDTRIDNYDLGRILNLGSLAPVTSNNGTKKNPCLSGDLIGDWREEILLRASDNTALYLFTTVIPTTYSFRTFLHDPQYRMAIAWQNTGYNQPPHLSYYLGGGMTTPSKPNIAIVGGVPPTVAITSPANNASFSDPATITINANAADADAGGSVSKVEFYNGTTLLGSDASAPYSYTWTNVAAGTHSITAVATDNSGAKTTSSAITVVVKTVPKKYIYTYDNSGNLSWTNVNSWSPKVVPSAIDTVIVRSGEAQITNLTHTAPVYVETGGALRLVNGSSTINDLHLQGGTLRLYTSNPGFTLTSTITVEKPSTIQSGSVATTVFTLAGTIKGSNDITKTGIGILEVTSTATNFTGNWNVTEGTLRVKSLDALGKCGIKVAASAVLDIATTSAASIYSLVVDTLGKVTLTQSLNTEVAVFGNENVLLGTYTASNRSAYINSAGILTVKNSILATSGSLNLCSGASVQLQTLSSSTYNWRNGTTQVGTAQSYSANAAGDYNVSVSNANGCKVTSANAKVTVNAAATATITTTTPTSFCTGGSVVLTASAGSSYKWFNGTTQVGTVQSYTASTSGDYTVEVINTNGCKATSTKTTVVVNVLPTATITAPSTSICSGSSVVLTASSGSSYKWLNGTSQVATSQTFTATAPGDYTVEVTNASGCKATSAKTTIVVNTASASVSTSGSTTLCSGESVVLTATSGMGYKWFNGTTQVGTSQSYTASTTGDYTVEVTNANGCKATSAKTAVTVNTTSTGTISASGSTTFCEGESVTLSFSSGTSYKWFNGTTQVGTNQTYTATTAGEYSAEVTNASGCKVTSAKLTVVVNPLPIAAITASAPTPICAGQSVMLTASAGVSYRWFLGTTLVGTNQTYSATATGDYTVEITNANGCKATSEKKNIMVANAPAVSFGLPSMSLCEGESQTIAVSASSQGDSYKWFNGNTLVGTGPSYTITTTGNYKVEVTNSMGCTATSDVVSVTVNSLPDAKITTSTSPALCDGASVTLTANAATGYKWFNGTTLVGTNQSYVATIAGYYTVEVTSASNCKATSAVTTVTVSTTPEATISSEGTTICKGTSKLLTANQGAEYKWYKGTTLVGTSQSYIATEEGDYKVEVSDENGCKGVSSILTIESGAASIPVITANGSNDICGGGTLELSTGTESAYVWYKGSTVAGTTQTILVTESGDYKVKITNASGCNATSEVATIEVITCPPTAIGVGQNAIELQVFPNPFMSELVIQQKGEFSYQLYDSKGILVRSGKATDQAQIGNDLGQGLYLLLVENSDGRNAVQIVKE